jgi:hypothetical protein
MSNPQKNKGDRAELEVQALIRDLTGWPARRQLGAGRLDDVGDISGVPDTVVQVVNYKDIARAINEKVDTCVEQQERAGATFGATFVRRPRGNYVVVMSPEQWATLMREAAA